MRCWCVSKSGIIPLLPHSMSTLHKTETPSGAAVSTPGDCLRLRSKAIDSQFHGLPRAQIDGRLLAKAYPWRGSSRDDVAGLQGHKLRDVRDEISDGEYHRSCRAVLVAMTVHLQPHGQIL